MPADPPPLSPDQRRRALEAWREYRAAPAIDKFLGDRNGDRTPGDTYVAQQADRDRRRVELIEDELAPLLAGFFAGTSDIAEFKSQFDGANKRRNLFGFSGMKGQMFFNMLYNAAERSAKTANVEEVSDELKLALPAPADDAAAATAAARFAAFVERLGENHVAAGNSARSRPKPSGVGFFLSSFWQVGDRDRWPAYYTNSVQRLGDLNLWEPAGDLPADLVAFARRHHELAALFAEESGRPVTIWDVEHVLSLNQANPAGGAAPSPTPAVPAAPVTARPTPAEAPPPAAPEPDRLPESFVPPVVAILPRLGRNDPALETAAANSGTTIPRAFEKGVHAAFTTLGYDATLLGQGAGREPDGRAVSHEDGYAILWDAKAYRDGYRMGTDDRAIRDYLDRGRRAVRPAVRNLYFVIVSASFRSDFDDAVRSLKMDTGVSEVCLLEADALVAAVDLKLRDPLTVTLGPDGLQRLFSAGGLLTAADVRGLLG